MRRLLSLSLISLLCAAALSAQAPQLVTRAGEAHLLVDGKPFLIVGGELHNSAGANFGELPGVMKKLSSAHLNTVLTPVYWELLEPSEGKFDFTHVDLALDAARKNNLRLVLLWFGSWKNGQSSYAPAWVKADAKRFPRVLLGDGKPIEVLSTFGAESLAADTRAFVALMRHLKERDAQHTVLMVQVENEVGIFGARRDHSPAAETAYAQPAPQQLIDALAHRAQGRGPWNGRLKGSWRELFGDSAEEWFTAWNYARYMNVVAEAGKKEWPLPMYVNAQLPATTERAGDYPSGGPHAANIPVWQAAAPAIDFQSPDIYWPEFELWRERYAAQGAPVFIPETRPGELGAVNAIDAIGNGALGYSPFGVEDLADAKDPVAKAYAAIQSLMPELLAAREKDAVRGLALHDTSPRSARVVALGGWLFRAELARDWSTKALQTKHGALLVIETSANEFLVAGKGLNVNISRDPDAGPTSVASGLASVDVVERDGEQWKRVVRQNGDENNQGHTLLLPADDFQILRVRLYSAR